MKKYVILISLLAAILFPLQNIRAFSFSVIGDTQKFKSGKNNSLHKTADRIAASGTSFTLALGDYCSGKNCAKQLKKWKTTAAAFFPNIYPVHGNHDLVSYETWTSTFNPPLNGPSGYVGWTYSFDFENSHFVVLDSTRSGNYVINADQRSWLEQDLAANTMDNVFVFSHQPAFPVSEKIGSSLDANPSERDALWQILDHYDVTAVFSGHEHLFYRKKVDSTVFPEADHEIYEMTLGNTDAYSHPKPKQTVEYYYRGKSYLIIDVAGSQITAKLYTIKGKLLNSFTFSKARQNNLNNQIKSHGARPNPSFFGLSAIL